MSIRYTPILGTLIYVLDRSTDRVLLVHRTARLHDEQYGKWNGLGGKVHPDEDVVTSAHRELLEEADLVATSTNLRGTISWPGFGPNGEDWFGFLFLVTEWTGTSPQQNEEGTLHWVERSTVLQAADPDPALRVQTGLDFYDGDRHFLPLMFDDDHRPFHGVMPYANGLPVSWNYVR